MDKIFLGKIAAAIAILAFILSKVGLEKIIPALLTMNPIYLALSYIIVVLSLVTHSLNLKILLNPIKKISWRKSFKYYSYGWALGAVTPARLGEYSVAHFLKTEGIDKSKSAAVITLDKILTLVALVALSSYNIVIFRSDIYQTAAVFVFAVAGFCLAAFKSKALRKYAVPFFQTLVTYIKTRKKYLASAFAFSIIKWSLLSASYFSIFLGFGIQMDFFLMVSVVSFSTIVGMVPITFSGLGVREGTFILLMSQSSVNPAISASVSLTALVLYYLVVAPIATNMALSKIRGG